MKTNEEIIKDFRNACVFWGQCDAKRVEYWLRTTLEEVRREEREKCIATVRQSRTVDEHLGVSVQCETARQQAIVDLLAPTKTDKQ